MFHATAVLVYAAFLIGTNTSLENNPQGKLDPAFILLTFLWRWRIFTSSLYEVLRCFLANPRLKISLSMLSRIFLKIFRKILVVLSGLVALTDPSSWPAQRTTLDIVKVRVALGSASSESCCFPTVNRFCLERVCGRGCEGLWHTCCFNWALFMFMKVWSSFSCLHKMRLVGLTRCQVPWVWAINISSC